MIFPRYRADGHPFVEMNASQQLARQTYLDKVARGEYRLKPLACLCGATTRQAIQIARKERHGLPQDTWMCRQCSLIYLSPYLDQQSLTRFYQEDYRNIYDGAHQPAGLLFQKQRIAGDQIISALRAEPLKNLRVFEIGCGAGGILSQFKSTGCDVSGCDLDQRYVRYGQDQGLTLHLGSFLDLPLKGSYDLILLCEVLEHMPEPALVLRKALNLLSPQGSLYIEVPLCTPHHELAAQLQNAHVWYFDEPTLKAYLETQGLEIDRSVFFTGYFGNFVKRRPSSSLKMRDASIYGPKIRSYYFHELIGMIRRPLSKALRWIGADYFPRLCYREIRRLCYAATKRFQENS